MTQHEMVGAAGAYAALVAQLSVELRWNLSAETQAAYVAALAELGPAAVADARSLLMNYHADHALVAALRDHAHAEHDQQWQAVVADVLRIVQGSGLGWSSDDAIERDDLAQVARLDLMRALPSYRYQSRLSTWIYSVIVRSVRTYLRDSRAAKRAGPRVSLDALGDPGLPAQAADSPEAHGDASALTALIGDILRSQPDPRLAQIFHLWAIEEQRVVAIGARLQLSASRVRALTQECVRILRAAPALHAWLGADDEHKQKSA